MNALTISDDDFGKFREFFYRKTGIQFDTSKRYFVDKRLLERMAATDSPSFRHYFTTLRFQASGEEPYSIAICLLERWADLQHHDVEIIASDIDTNILTQARAGLYSERAVSQMPVSYLQKYFRRTAHGYQLIDDVRSSVEFTRVNLSSRADTRPYRDFDVVFCRNLLIYFDDVSRKAAAETFYDALRPGGFICLGHSESMSRISSLYHVRKFPEAIVYQKPME